MPSLPELEEMDDKQLNESLSQFQTEVRSKKGEEYSKSSLISFFSELTCDTVSLIVTRTFSRFVMILKVVRKTGGVIIFNKDLNQ